MQKACKKQAILACGFIRRTKVHKEVQKMAEKILNSYETIFIVDATLDEENVTALKDKFTSLIEKNGELESVDEWGKRRLAYEIDDRTEGFYYLVNFKADGDFPKELERQYKITEGILRTIVIRKDEE